MIRQYIISYFAGNSYEITWRYIINVSLEKPNLMHMHACSVFLNAFAMDMLDEMVKQDADARNVMHISHYKHTFTL